MKKALLVFVVYCGIFSTLNVAAQSWQWAKSATCSSHLGGSEGWLVKVDHVNNVFIAGFYYGDSICIGDNTFRNPINPTNNTQTLIAKYDSSGNLLWSHASSNGQSKPIALTTDKEGNVYVFGSFTKDSIRFNDHLLINPGFDTANPLFNTCFYLLKYSPAGAVIWGRTGTTNFHPDGDYLHPGGIAVDVAGNVYITSSFNQRTIAFGTDTLYNADPVNATNDLFVAKYDTSGQIIWYKSFGGTKDDYVLDMAAGNDNKIYLTGYFKSGFIQFGSTPKLFTGNRKSYLVSLDTAGNALWAKSAGSKAITRCVATDAANNIYTSGGFIDSLTFDGYSYYNTNGGFFLVKYDNNGTIIRPQIFYPTLSLSSCCNTYSMTTDDCSNAWISINMEPGKGIKLNDATTVYPPAGSVDPTFIAGFNDTGMLLNYVSLPSGGGYNSGLANSGLTADHKGNIIFTGDYRAIDPFIIGKDTLHLHNGQQTNIFLAKYNIGFNCDSIPTPVYPDVPIITLYPNPASDICVLDYYGNLGTGAQAAIRDVTGRLITTFPVTTQLTPFSVAYLPNGLYMCIIKIEGRSAYTIMLTVLR